MIALINFLKKIYNISGLKLQVIYQFFPVKVELNVLPVLIELF